MMNIYVILVNILPFYFVASSRLKCTDKPNVPAPCLTMGLQSDFDNVLYDTVEEKSGIPLLKRDEDFVFPPDGLEVTWSSITYLRVTNGMATGDEGSVTLTQGGVHHRNLTLHLESQRGSGYNFHIRIQGV